MRRTRARIAVAIGAAAAFARTMLSWASSLEGTTLTHGAGALDRVVTSLSNLSTSTAGSAPARSTATRTARGRQLGRASASSTISRSTPKVQNTSAASVSIGWPSGLSMLSLSVSTRFSASNRLGPRLARYPVILARSRDAAARRRYPWVRRQTGPSPFPASWDTIGIADLLMPNRPAYTPRVGSAPLLQFSRVSVLWQFGKSSHRRCSRSPAPSIWIGITGRRTPLRGPPYRPRLYLRQRIGPHALNDNRRLYLEIAPLARARLGSRVVFFLLQDLDFSHFARFVASHFARLRFKPTETCGFQC